MFSSEKKSSAKVRSSQLELDDDREDDTQKHQSIEAGFDASKNNETDENLQSKPLIKKRSASVDRASGKTMQSAAISAKTKTAQLKPKPNEKQKRPSEVIEIMEVVADPKELTRSESDQTLTQSGRWSNEERKAIESDNELADIKLRKSFVSESNLANVIDDGYESSENLLLDPQHPLLKRYQLVVREQLIKLQQELKFSLKEAEELLKRKQQEYKSLGESIYSVESELTKLRVNLDSKTVSYELAKEELEKLGASRIELKDKTLEFDSKLEQLAKADKITNEELRRINIQIGDKKQDVLISDHMKIVKNAVHKAKQDLKATKQEKAKQELLVDKMIASTGQAETEMIALDEEMRRIVAEINDKRDTLVVLNTELQAISSEKKSLLQLWNVTVNGMKKKGDELTNFETYLKSQRDEAVRIEVELNGLSKEYAQNRDKNDNLASMLIRLEQEVEKYQGLIERGKLSAKETKSELDDLKTNCDIVNKEVASCQKERSQLQSQLNALSMKIRLEQKEIAKLEDEALEWTNETQTKDRSLDTILKELKNINNANREIEKQIADLETQLAEETMIWAETEEKLSELNKSFKLYKDFVAEKQASIDRTQNDVNKRAQMVDKVHAQFSLISKKLNTQIKGSDIGTSSDISPLKNEIASVQKIIQKSDEKVVGYQAQWLKVQDQLIRLNEKIEQESGEIEKLDSKISLYESMKLRFNGEMKQSQEEIFQLERNVENFRTKIRKLNEDITKKVGTKVSLESERLTAEGHLAGLLKDSELECVQLEEKLLSVKSERERALSKIEEAKKQIALWEEKVEQVKVTKDAVAGAKGQEDLIMLRSQVHRMQLRCAQLSKQQEIMLKEMEKAVSRREVLLKKGEAATIGKTNLMTQTQLDSVLTGLRRKVKQYKKDLESSEIELEDFRTKSEAFRSDIQSKVVELKEFEQQDNELRRKIEDLAAQKHKNLQLLISKQVRHKNLEDAREGRYQRSLSSVDEAKSELTREKVKRERLMAVVAKLYEKFPHLNGEIKKAELLLQC